MYYLKENIYTYGADPEFFVFDHKVGEHISPHEITKGTKQYPEPLEFGGFRWGLQVDGLALEINTPVFRNITDLFLATRKFVKGHLTKLVRQRTGNKNLVLSRDIVNIFSEEVWQDVPDCNKELGCSPDFDALKLGETNEPPVPENPRFRTTAGHISFGWGEDVAFEESCAFVLNLIKAGVHKSLLSYAKRDQEKTRRTLYGDIGAFRHRPYGVEWRAPSNMWCHFPDRALKRMNFEEVPFLPDVWLEQRNKLKGDV